MQSQYDEEEIDLKELFFVLLSKWKYILFSTVCLGVATALVNMYILIPQYASTSKLYILSKSTSLTSLADLQVGTSLTQDYKLIINSRPVVEEVIENLKLDTDYEGLVGRITVDNPTDSRMLYITVTDESSKEAKRIADELARVSAAYIAEKMDQDPPNIFEYGYANPQHVSPNRKKNTLIGALAGALLASAVVIVLYLMDDTIKTEEDIEKYLNLNTLAVVPEKEQDGADKKKGKKKKPVRQKKGK